MPLHEHHLAELSRRQFVRRSGLSLGSFGLALLPRPARAAEPEPWLHPAGMISRETVAEMRGKCERYVWARKARKDLLASVESWLKISMVRIRELTPRRRGNVFHNFSCPADGERLKFDRWDNSAFHCPTCAKTYPPDTDAGIYSPDHKYHGTLLDGWACLFFLDIAQAAWRLGLAYSLTEDIAFAKRAAEILLWFAELTPTMPRDRLASADVIAIRHDLPSPLPERRRSNAGYGVIFTYHREGDNRMLVHFATAYELLRDAGVLTAEEKRRIERDLIKPFCDDVVRDAEFTTDWNNVHLWLLCVMQVGVALEDRDYLDYAFGLGAYAPDKKPQHRSMAYIARHHFLPDGAFWELCSGYHLFSVQPYAQSVLVGRNLARQEPERFPPGQFDATDPRRPDGNTVRRALRWCFSLAQPDQSMSVLGDSDRARNSLITYQPLAEIAYRSFGIDEAACYPELAEERDLWGLIYGADEIEQRPLSFRSARLSSGFAALRQEFGGDRVYAGLNALLPGGGHQHADRLELFTYARDRALGQTKGVPYNNLAIKAAGNLSFSHNTVSVDETSQRRGDILRGDEIPRIRYFQSNAEMQYAEAWGDDIYPQTRRYRRAVLLLDGLILDIFDVAGGSVHDWFYHSDGASLDVDLPMTPDRDFQPADYVIGGSSDFQRGGADAAWSAVWTLPPATPAPSHLPGRGRPVRHRVTMLGREGTEVFHLRTYPILTKSNHLEGVTHSLMVRRRDNATPFVSLFDTSFDDSPPPTFEAIPVNFPGAVAVRLRTSGLQRLVVHNPAPQSTLEFTAGRHTLKVAGHLAVLRLDDADRVLGAALVHGEELSHGGFVLRAKTPATVCLTRQADGFEATAAADLAYETLDGEPIHAACDDVKLDVKDGEQTQTLIARRAQTLRTQRQTQ